MDHERRNTDLTPGDSLTSQLNAMQQASLVDLETFGWVLKFVRKPLFRQPIPVVFNTRSQQFVVLNADGTLDERPEISIRD